MRATTPVVPAAGITLLCFALSLLLFLNSSAADSASRTAQSAPDGLNPGPDLIMGEIPSLQQFGSSGTQVGLAMGTDSCNGGEQELNFFAMPNTDHPVMAQNLYRMSGGTANNERFEQIGQSWLMHGFFALQQNACGFGCTPASGGTHLGAGCSNPDSIGINAGPINMGSRAWVNPFTGLFPATANSHTGHAHTGTSHRVLVAASDLDAAVNPGATYYAESQYVTPHEYAWCQAHPGECNMSDNASYRQFKVAGTTSFVFSAVGSTVRMTPAINAWPGATIRPIEAVPGIDGRVFIAYKVTGPVAGVWHYEYAIYNQNLDRAIQSFSVPLGCGAAVGNLGFHAPLNHPGFPNDGTQGSLGFSNTPWTTNQSSSSLTWNSETVILNENANAIRWGTLYNFRFDSDRPPQAANATIGFFKTGTPMTVEIQGPAPDTCTGTPTPTPTPTGTPPPTPFPEPAVQFAISAPAKWDVNVPLSFGVTAQNMFGNTDPNYSGTVHFTSSDPTAVLPADSTLTNGTGIFIATFHTAGSQTITATDTQTFITGTSNPINVFGSTPTPTATPCTVEVWSENFDGEVAPTLPPGGGAVCWSISTIDPDTPPNCAFTPDQAGVSDCVLDSPAIAIPSASCILSFRNNFDTEFSDGIFWDGGVLEISSPNISNGDFVDVTDPLVGGSIPTGGYTGEISGDASNPLAGRMAWSGNSKGYIDTVVNLGPNVSGQTIRLRWRFGSDEANGAPGWRIDTIRITDGLCEGTPTPTPTPPKSTPTPTPTPGGTATPTPTPITRALNLSTRLRVQTGDNAGIAGFIITGSAAKHLLFRGIGPSLSGSGVSDALANPTLDLRDSAGVRILANNDWGETQGNEIIATGIPPTDDLEAAIVETLEPGSYTVILRGMGMTSGVGLVEIYDLDDGANSKLANLSTRALVSTGNNVVIAGFILDGSGNDTVIVRGVGPSLTPLGVANALADPTLELRDSSGTLLVANNNWQDDPLAAQLTAAGLAPTDSLESGIAAMLSPGLYTALLAGRNDSTGVGLVEIYDLGTPLPP